MIYLIGYMAAGKSTLARMAHQACGVNVVDTDERISELIDPESFIDIFNNYGEETFRSLEMDVLHKVTETYVHDTIVSTGGGLPCYADNMDYMNSHGTTLYLRWTPENLVQRINITGGVKLRPMLAHLKDEQLLEFVTKHLTQREKYYSKAHITLMCDGMDDFQILEQFLKILKH